VFEDEEYRKSPQHLAGPDEFKLRQNKFCIDSPLSIALNRKRVSDEMKVVTPSGNKNYFISSIYY
jgi:transcription elongation factor GreB